MAEEMCLSSRPSYLLVSSLPHISMCPSFNPVSVDEKLVWFLSSRCAGSNDSQTLFPHSGILPKPNPAASTWTFSLRVILWEISPDHWNQSGHSFLWHSTPLDYLSCGLCDKLTGIIRHHFAMVSSKARRQTRHQQCDQSLLACEWVQQRVRASLLLKTYSMRDHCFLQSLT